MASNSTIQTFSDVSLSQCIHQKKSIFRKQEKKFFLTSLTETAVSVPYFLVVQGIVDGVTQSRDKVWL